LPRLVAGGACPRLEITTTTAVATAATPTAVQNHQCWNSDGLAGWACEAPTSSAGLNGGGGGGRDGKAADGAAGTVGLLSCACAREETRAHAMTKTTKPMRKRGAHGLLADKAPKGEAIREVMMTDLPRASWSGQLRGTQGQ
jgi:hypothetical protein